MGINIHKMLGYGLIDLKTDKYKIVDERINPLGYLCSNDSEEVWTREGWEKYFKSFSNSYFRDFKEWTPYDSVKFNPEYGLKNILLFIPPRYKDWYRFDNIIDYTEETRLKKGQTNRFEVYDCGIWPYSSLYMDLRTFTKAPRNAHDFWFHVRSARYSKSKKQKTMHTNMALSYMTKLGFRDIEEAKKNIVPEVPDLIQLLCKYLCIFNDENDIFILKPMMYIYWG